MSDKKPLLAFLSYHKCATIMDELNYSDSIP